MTKEKLNIYQKLHAVMKGVSYVKKEDKKVNNQYNFASHDGVTSAVRPHLVDNGIMAIPQNLRTEQNGNRTEAYFDLRFINIDNPDDFIDVPTFGYGIDPQDKGVGKALSYGVKYALLKALSLETGDDPERDNIDHEPQKKPMQKPQSKPQEKKPDPMAELCGKVKKQLNEAETVEVLDFVWKGFQEKLTPVKEKQPKWYAALETQFNQRMSDLSQKPTDEIPH